MAGSLPAGGDMSDTSIIQLDGAFDAELLLNSRMVGAEGRETSYSKAMADEALSRISSWSDYDVTPLRALPGAAAELGLGALWCKDESRRLGLASFKALGAVYASVCEVSALLEKRLGHEIADRDLLDGKYARDLAQNYLICCTDGNHGFSVAHAARRMGCRAVIYIPSGVSADREQALRREGAEVVRIDGIYDEAYEAVEKVAHGDANALLISDSATPYYQDIPVKCMTGYSVMAHEIVEQLGGELPTHVMLPAGCGGMAAAMITAFHHLLGARAPQAIIVEPVTADCVFASGLAGQPVVVEGDLETIMGGLSCAAVSHVAWPTITTGASAFLRMNDEAAVEAMRLFANPRGNDPRVVAGETGAAGLAAVIAICGDRRARDLVGLGQDARVLVINCEGATDPTAFQQLTGQRPEAA
jgi:diaminopropionate ammonia-lyase